MLFLFFFVYFHLASFAFPTNHLFGLTPFQVENHKIINFPVVLAFENSTSTELFEINAWMLKHKLSPVYRYNTRGMSSDDICHLLNINPYLIDGFNLITLDKATIKIDTSCLDFETKSFVKWQSDNAPYSSFNHDNLWSVNVWKSNSTDICHVHSFHYHSCEIHLMAGLDCDKYLVQASMTYLD